MYVRRCTRFEIVIYEYCKAMNRALTIMNSFQLGKTCDIFVIIWLMCTHRVYIWTKVLNPNQTSNVVCISYELCPFVPTVAFSQLNSNMCCPRDCVSRHNGGTSGAALKPLRDDSALRALSTLFCLRGAPEVPPLCRETQSLGQQMFGT